MKRNKYIVFAAIGFELIGLIVLALWLGSYLHKKEYIGQAGQAFLILAAFLVWFISLMSKLKKMNRD